MHFDQWQGKEKTSRGYTTVLLRAYRSLIILQLLLVSCAPLQAQDSEAFKYFRELEAPDSILFDTIKSYYRSKIYTYPDSVLALTEIHMARAEAINNAEEMIRALNYRANARYAMEDLDGTLSELEKVVALADKEDNQYLKYTGYNNMGNVHYMRRNMLEAFRYYNKSLSFFKEQGYLKEGAGISMNVGLIYMAIEDYDKAQTFFEETVKIESSLPKSFIGGDIWRSLGSIKYKKKMYHEAIANYNKSLAIYESSENPKAVVDLLGLLSKAYFGLGLKDKAIEYAEKAIALAEKWNYALKINPIKVILVNIYLEDDLAKAIDIADEIRATGLEKQENFEKVEIYQMFYNCYKKQDNAVLALQAHENFTKYSDSLQIEIDKAGILKQKIEYEYAEQLRQKEIAFQEEENRLKQTQKKRVSGILIGSLISIFGILLFAWNKQKRNNLEKEKFLQEIESLKATQKGPNTLQTEEGFQLNRESIEKSANRPINETDWKVLNILLEDPFIKNQLIAEKAFMSVDGIGSSLRRMYQAFEIKESRYMKIALLMEVIKLSK